MFFIEISRFIILYKLNIFWKQWHRCGINLNDTVRLVVLVGRFLNLPHHFRNMHVHVSSGFLTSTYAFDLCLWPLPLTFAFDLCLWPLPLTLTIDNWPWQLTLTFDLDTLRWYLTFDRVVGMNNTERWKYMWRCII